MLPQLLQRRTSTAPYNGGVWLGNVVPLDPARCIGNAPHQRTGGRTTKKGKRGADLEGSMGTAAEGHGEGRYASGPPGHRPRLMRQQRGRLLLLVWQ